MKGKTALVTGSSDRIGKAISLHLAELGYNIILHYNQSGKKAEELGREISGMGVDYDLIHIDFQSMNDLEKALAGYPGTVDLQVLVNNASIFLHSGFETGGSELLDKHLKINFYSVYLLTKWYTHHFNKGLIINMLDTKTEKNDTSHLDYLLSKRLIREFTLISAFNLAPNFRVNAISPGLILPPRGKDNDYLYKLSQSVPLKKTGDLSQIQKAVEFIINTEFITGQIIYINGGEHL